MSLTNRFFIYGPFAIFVVLVVAVSLRWWVEAEAFSKRLDAMNGRQIAPGVTMHFARKRVGGFPFRLDATFSQIEVRIDTPHGPSEWQASEFALHRLTYGARRTLFESAGRQRLSWTGEDGRHHELPFEAGSTRASATEDDGGIARFDLQHCRRAAHSRACVQAPARGPMLFAISNGQTEASMLMDSRLPSMRFRRTDMARSDSTLTCGPEAFSTSASRTSTNFSPTPAKEAQGLRLPSRCTEAEATRKAG